MSTIRPNPNPRPSEITWAKHQHANLREPIQALKEKGWQVADVPTASNFNWLFHEFSKWDKYLEGRMNGVADDLVIVQGDLNQQTEELRRDLKITVTVLGMLLNKVLMHHPDQRFITPRIAGYSGLMVFYAQKNSHVF